MDEKEIKSALDFFEDDDFLSAKEKLRGQILKAKNEFLKNKLGLQKDIIDQPVSKTKTEDVINKKLNA